MAARGLQRTLRQLTALAAPRPAADMVFLRGTVIPMTAPEVVPAAPAVEPLRLRTMSALGERAVPEVSVLVDVLGSRIGEERLFRLAARESHIPERSTLRIAPMADPTLLRWPLHWPRPARLLARPETIETMALLPDHPPVHFVWCGVRRRVTRGDGPEPCMANGV